MPDDAARAAAFVTGLERGFVRSDEVIAWADGIIAREEHPNGLVCELACHGGDRSTLLTTLIRLAEGAREPLATGLAVERARDAIESGDADASAIAKWIYFDAQEREDLWGDLRSEATHYWDEIDLARDGIHGDEAEIVERFVRFLETASRVMTQA